jgi:hypothetical protein
MKQIFLLFTISILLISCEKNIDFKTNQTEETLVVDGTIEDNREPRIVLTHSLNYFSSITPQIALSSFVHNAVATVTDGTVTSTLKEYEIPLGGGYSLFYYTNNDSFPLNRIIGEQGKKYDLKIVASGKEYIASTNILNLTKTCDSLWWKKVPNNPDTNLATLVGKFIDPPQIQNYIKYFTKINNDNFLPGDKSAYDDQVINGKTYSIQIDQGVDKSNSKIDDKTKGFFHRGDTVTLKLCNIDKASYTFWNTWEFAYRAIGNPFSAPNKVLGNISNGALGAFCGYSVQYKSLIIPK